MPDQLKDFIHPHRVSSLTLHGFEKNPDAPSCVVALVKGIATHGEPHLAGQAGISHKPMFNDGFQV